MQACPEALGAKRLAVGVSGGGDSLALALLADAWGRRHKIAITALTVDHGLRADSIVEARQVAGWMTARGIAHEILRVTEAAPVSGVQRAARDWRLAGFDRWRRDHDVGAVLLAHTAEDQAETLWLRISADSGPDGLGAMHRQTRVAGLPIARPLLAIAKRRLIATCRAHGQPWIEDPSNNNPAFDRVRLRRLAPALGLCGLGPDTAQRITASMAAARQALDRFCANFIEDHGGLSPAGVAWFDGAAFAALPAAFTDLLLSRLLWAIGGGALPARRKRVARLGAALRGSSTVAARTLGGCVISRLVDGRVVLFREAAACAKAVRLVPGRKTRWDNRFEACWRGPAPVSLGALEAEGWRWMSRHAPESCVNSGLAALPYAARLSHPAIRELDGTVSVPHFVMGDGMRSTASGWPLEIEFYPDANWIVTLVKSVDTD
ncbi:MAG: tRNA lysidine(34) synthetase TilS [Proteobacteria bacterium]|nr:tRNA lysidine(34) synthetase TilS [Pseudomonadota bacterium]